jgi:two-component system sensor histidine kinase BaeS
MKTKLFLAFLAVILIALVSNFIFRSLIESDFDEYVRGSREDQLYWVLAAIEGSYGSGQWNQHQLNETVHWGVMLGFDLRVLDTNGEQLAATDDVIDGLEANMRRRMESIIDVTSPAGAFERYPLFVRGEEIGILMVREMKRRGNVAEKERIFKKRGEEFLITSFLIAGGGAVFLSLIFSLFLTNPIKKLKEATEMIAEGSFDVTVEVSSRDEIGQLADSFNFMSQALKREDMIRKRLASNIAHELRTPLTIMKANLEGMADGIVEQTDQQIESLKEEVERLIWLVEGVEDMTRAEATFLRKDIMETIDLQELIEAEIMNLEKIIKERNVDIRCLTHGPLEVVTDREKLKSIVKNLITNALKFTDKGEIAIDIGTEKDTFYVSITDTGRGMHEGEVAQIFERHYKGVGSKGMGIGLSIVKELVDALGGTIEVRSAVGQGSMFRVSLPEGGSSG